MAEAPEAEGNLPEEYPDAPEEFKLDEFYKTDIENCANLKSDLESKNLNDIDKEKHARCLDLTHIKKNYALPTDLTEFGTNRKKTIETVVKTIKDQYCSFFSGCSFENLKTNLKNNKDKYIEKYIKKVEENKNQAYNILLNPTSADVKNIKSEFSNTLLFTVAEIFYEIDAQTNQTKASGGKKTKRKRSGYKRSGYNKFRSKRSGYKRSGYKRSGYKRTKRTKRHM